MAFAREYISYRRSLGQQDEDPISYPVKMFGKFDTEVEFADRVRQEEEIRDRKKEQ